MFLRRPITTFTGNYSEQINRSKNELDIADAIVKNPILDYIKTCKYT